MKRHNYLTIMILITFTLLLGKFIFYSDGLAWLLKGLRPLIYVGVMLYLLIPLVEYLLSRTKMKRTASVVVSFLIVFLVMAIFVGMILPSVIESTRRIINSIPQTNNQFLLLIEKIPFISHFIDTTSLANFINAVGSWFISYSEELLSYGDTIIGSVVSFLGTLSIIVLSLLMAFYALRDNDKIAANVRLVLESYLPASITKPTFKVLLLLDEAFKKFLIGKLYTCLFLGVIVTVIILIFNLIGPWGLHIPYAPLIGFIIGITNIIPYIGPLIGTIPCLFLAMLSGFWEVLVLLIIVLVSQQIDNIFISPKILGKTVGLKPFWIVLSVTLGGSLFGALGMVLSVPIISVILQLVEERVNKVAEQ